MNTRIRTLLIVAVCLGAGCTRGGDPPNVAGPADGAAAPTDRIDIPPIVRSNLGITFANVERRRVDATIRVPGAFELQPLARHEYRMTLPGTVDLLVDQYQAVTPGDTLYRFRSPEWPALQHEIIEGEQAIDTAHGEIGVAGARLEETRRRLDSLRERLAALAEAEFKQADLELQAGELAASLPRLEAELRLAETKLTNAQRTREHALHRASAATGIGEAELEAASRRNGTDVPAYRAIDWIEVHATEVGIVETLAVTDGAFVQPPAMVLATVDPARVRFRAMALQADLTKLAGGDEARIVPPSSPGIDAGDAVPASVEIGLEANPAQRTITLLAQLDETRPWIRPGVSAFLEVVVDSTRGPALAIPRAAIVKDGIEHVFFRRDPADPNQAIRVIADMGVSDGRWVVVQSGVGPQDAVVLDGAYELKLASQEGGTEVGHYHADGTFHEADH